jgi:hypothetical protein
VVALLILDQEDMGFTINVWLVTKDGENRVKS